MTKGGWRKSAIILTILLGSSFRSVFASAAPGDFSLVLAPDTVQSREEPGLEKFLSDAEALLPPRLKAAISREITVRFTNDLGSSGTFQVPSCGPGQAASDESGGGAIQIRGQVSAGFFQSESSIHEIRLNAAMKSEILEGPDRSTPYACGHKTLYGLAMATLLHEISHIYDFSNELTPERQRQMERCRAIYAKPLPNPSARWECASVGETRVVSGAPTFASLVDWDDENGQRLNFAALRSPDPYEYSSLEEEFAVNMEYFLLDPEYACRRPNEFEYLKDHFDGFDPFPSRRCRIPTEVQLTNNTLGRSATDTIDLDPSRIYQIHFLFASQGPMMMSNWGHAMFRIILCDPSRKEVGPDCLHDLKDQIVVSFAGNPGSWTISAWAGLTGSYPSELYLYRMYPNVVNEYTVDQFRDLISLPLKLSDAEKTRFVQRVLEQYWQYTGRYYFLSNNCATEAMHLLKGVIRDFDFQYWDIQTPEELYGRLAQAGYIDTRLLDDQDAAAKMSYRFASEKDLYNGAFTRIKQVSPGDVPVDTFDGYVKQSDAADRLALYKKLNSLASVQRKQLASRFYILESYIYHSAGDAFLDAVMGKLQSESSAMGNEASRMVQLLDDVLPWNRRMTGYGIAMPQDFPASPTGSSETSSRDAELQELYGDVMAWAKKNLAARAAELDAITANLKLFLSDMQK